VARIKDESVEAVKAATDIVTIVEGFTRLRKSGGRFVGLCPFHQEKTPSFGVSPDRGTFKCFGCGEGGDAIAFVEKIEKVDFVGAIEWLAGRFNVPLEYEESSPEEDRKRRQKERLFQLLDRAATFYETYLWGSESGVFARDYLASRGLSEQTCREFRIGFAPGGTALARAAATQGFTREELSGAGLINRRGNDYFTRRLLFPLSDARGKVRGFQARKLYEDDPLRAKYVNSPEGDLFRKGDLLYGLDLARAAIAKQDRAVVVEGNTDVVALRQAGFEPAVASMGTALTAQQLKELVRLTKRLYLCFDADAAGQDATLRGMELAAAQGFDIHVVSLPSGTDPADDPASFEEQLRGSEHYFRHRVRVENSSRDRQQAFEAIRTFLAPIPESPERQEAQSLAADLLGLTKETAAGLAPRLSRAVGVASPRLLDADWRLERDALAGVAAYPELVEALREFGPGKFHDPTHQLIARALAGESVGGDELAAVRPEFDARVDSDGITELVARQLLLRLKEKDVRREFAAADAKERTVLYERLQRILETLEDLSLKASGARQA
jgi:DNA primase